MAHKAVNLILTFLVFIYIIFEELVWESIARPIYEYIHSLKILKKVEIWVNKINSKILVVLFLILFIKVELLGLAAMALIASGKVISGAILYATKIPIGAFTFWLFKISKNKLMSFKWFSFLYNLIMTQIDKIKQSDIYINIKKKTSIIKNKIKSLKSLFSKDNEVLKQKIQKIYRKLKQLI